MAELFAPVDPKKPEANSARLLAVSQGLTVPVVDTAPSPADVEVDRSGTTTSADVSYAPVEAPTPAQFNGAAVMPHQGQFAPATEVLDDGFEDDPFESAASAGDIEGDISIAPKPVVPPPPTGGSTPSMLDDFDSLPAWKQDELRRAREFQARLEEQAAAVDVPASPAPAAPSAPSAPAAQEPPQTYRDDDAYDDDDDDGVRPKKSFLAGLPNPLKVFEKNPKLVRPAAIGAVGIAVATVAAFMFGGSTASNPPAAPPAVVVDTPPGEDVGPQVVTLLPKAVSASCPPGSTSPSMAFTAKPENAWVCQRAHGIDGAVMNIIFANTVTVKAITVMPGWNYVAPNGRDHWNEHRLTTKILWRLGGNQYEQVINPSRSGSTLTLPGNGVATTVMSLTILETTTPDAVSVDTGPGGDGGLLSPGGDLGPQNADVDKSTAIGSVTITGVEN